ncbi:MAG: anaerobic carbon-monoxide dehydrogenase catalytic subunit [Candidatus Hodarchaeales archaeon]
MTEKEVEQLSINEDAQKMILKAKKDNVELVWDRNEMQGKRCSFCEQGLSCQNCAMGPCRIGGSRERGVCGADADVIVARNFGRMVASGSASHSDHGRDLAELLHTIGKGKTDAYSIRDEGKLRTIAKEIGVSEEGKSVQEVAKEVGSQLLSDYGILKDRISFLKRVPPKRLELWEKLGITPRGIDREVVEMMHRTHMGVDNDMVSLALHAARTALADGWGGSMIGTEVSDIIFGTPKPVKSTINLGVLKKDKVNVLVHGHNPIVSETIVAASKDDILLELAKSKGASGINIVGLCCTGNEILMRQGIPLAGNHLMTELTIVTGVADLMIVDYQCIMPSLVTLAGCYHTKFISTSEKAHFTGATHIGFTFENAAEKAKEVVKLAIEAYVNRDPAKIDIPVEPVEIMAGFSNEAILGALGGTPGPLLDVIKAGKIKGVVGIVGCNNPRYANPHDYGHVELAKEMIKRNILVLGTGCATSAFGKHGLLVPEAAEMAGEGLKEVCKSLGIPPVLHVGSCVDNSRILHLCGVLANALGVDISDLPVAAAAPEWYSEKAVAIGLYAVASGIFTVLGVVPPITGSENFTNLALDGLEGVLGARFAVNPDPIKMADMIEDRINEKRKGLGLE